MVLSLARTAAAARAPGQASRCAAAQLTVQRAFATQAKIVYTYTDEAPML
eukprot:SAG22_NODE_3280_length_1807_cov_16.975995_1_plen_49_part_01